MTRGDGATEPSRCRVFTAELARLLVLAGYDVETTIRTDVRIDVRLVTPDRKRAGITRRWHADEIEFHDLAPMSLAIAVADEIREHMPKAS